MTLYQIVSYLKQIALSSPYIRTAEEGSVYTIMNGNPHSKYGVFVVSQTLHRQDDIFDYYGLNLFVIDRLVDDLESNRLQIQSLAKEVLANTILTFVTKFYGITHNELQFHPFTEKFVDLTAGQYVQVTFQVPKNLICPDDYNLDFYDKYRLLPLNVEITDNGIYEYNPVSEDYDGYDSVKITVNVPQTGASINNQTKIVEIEENGDYTIAYDDGYTGLEEVNFKVDVSGYTQEDLDDAYESGITSGITYQKSLLQDITIEHNGEYTNENGYSAITVNVPQTGESIYNQTKSIEYSGNGEYTLTYDEGYTGLEAVNININVPQSAYTSGYTQEDLDNAYASGETYQKSLLSAITITENGTYERENGYSAITVNVNTVNNQTKTITIIENTATTVTFDSGYTGLESVIINTNVSGYTQEDLDNAWENGYESGYTDAIIQQENYLGEYFSIQLLEDSVIRIGNNTADYTYYTYKINEGEWITGSTYDGTGDYITAQQGSIIKLKNVNATLQTQPIIISSNGNFNVYGNIMSLYYGDDFEDKNTIPSSSNEFYKPVGYQLFSGCTKIISADNLILPATALTRSCYYEMFYGCSSLVQAPTILPATILADYCYYAMFWGCSSLTNAPILPATTLAVGCYNNMFARCSSLTKAPILPATILADYCYKRMYDECSSLRYVCCLATDISSTECTQYWLQNVGSSGTFIKKAGVTWPSGASGIPNNWTVIEE